MNFLNDKKNLPIIIGVAAVVVIGAVGSGLYFSGVIGGPAQAPVVATTSGSSYPGAPAGPGMAPNGSGSPGGPMRPGMSPNPGMPGAPGMTAGRPGMPGAPMRPGMDGPAVPGLGQVANGGPSAGERALRNPALAHAHHGKVIAKRPGAPGLPGAPGALPGAPGALPGAPGAQVASATGTSTAVVFVGDPTIGPDPFYTKPPPRIHIKPFGPGTTDEPLEPLPPIPVENSTTTLPMPINVDPGSPTDAPVVNDTLRRVSGILHSTDGVYAVLETNGVSQTVQPGDDVGGAKVVAIQDDGVTLKTTDNVTLHVPLADTASVVTK